MGQASNAIAVVGLCLLAARGHAATPVASPAAQDPASLEVLVFADQVTVPPMKTHAESLTLQLDIAHATALPPQLTIYEVKGPAERAGARVARAGAGPAVRNTVIAVYSKLGPHVRANEIAGSSAVPDASGKPLRHYRLVVLSKPTEGSERAYNDWYDHEHVPDVLRVPGFTAAQRLKLIQITPATYPLPGYAVCFEFDSYDLQATVDDVRHRLATGITKSSPAFDMPSSITRYYEVTAAQPGITAAQP
jgi:hypothetical protein